MALPEAADPPEIVLKSAQFRHGREESWRRLDALLLRVERRGIGSLSIDELQALPLLYRAAVSSLSVARSIALDRNLLIYLESLALRGFLCVYGPRIGVMQGSWDFLRRGFPAAVWAARFHVAIAALMLLAGGVAGFLLTLADEAWFSTLVPAAMAEGRGPASTASQLSSGEIFAPWPGFAEAFVALANFLFTHNTVIGILTFSLGIAGGVPTLLLLGYQGLILGAFIALHYDRGLLVDFLGWIAIHGVTELTAVILCGAGGLVVAESLLFPGRHSRLDSVALRGRLASQIALGAVMLFFVAGILEGGFRQLVESTELRFLIGFLTGMGWLAYFRRGRRGIVP